MRGISTNFIPNFHFNGHNNKSIPFRSNVSPAEDSDAVSAFNTQSPTLGSPTGSVKESQKGGGYYMDMSLEDQHEWEEQEMMHDVDFPKCHIDPAPFQLVEKSSLLKVNSSS